MTSTEDRILVVGPSGPVGTIDRADWLTEAGRLYLTLLDNRRILLRREQLLQRDGLLHLGHDLADAPAAPPPVGTTPAAIVVPVVQEEATIGKHVTETRVRVQKTVHEREVVVDPPLLQEVVDVQRVRVDRIIEKPADVRQEGDVTIVPVMEEVYVIEKRLMLREEVRLTKRRTETHAPQKLKLRYDEVTVERTPVLPAEATSTAKPPPLPHTATTSPG